MRQIGINEATEHIGDVLSAVESGEEVLISRSGRPIVRLSPVSEKERVFSEAVRSMDERRKRARLDGISLRELIDEGRGA